MLSRRDLIRMMTAGALGGGAAATLGCASSTPPSRSPAGAEPADFSIAFLTDPHVDGRNDAASGCRRAFEHALAQRPEAVITGGDLFFDLLEVERDSADQQFELLEQSLETVPVPMYHAIGNHDCYGVSEKSSVSAADPLWGKGYFLDRLGLERTYTSFDHRGWHFVILDTIDLQGTGYRGWIDDEQLAWLEADLARADRPTVVAGHMPLFSNYIEWKRGTEEGIPPFVSVGNCHQVAQILVRHPVKLVLAGHLHVNEVFRYKGIEFANLGAISGNWWHGPRDGFEEGYSMLDFRGDQVSWRYVDYGWEAAAAAG